MGNVETRDRFGLREASLLVGVSDDTLRRAITRGDLAADKDDSGRTTVTGVDLVAFAESRQGAAPDGGAATSARNRLVGIVTDVRVDSVMAQVRLRCGPFTITSLMSSDAVRDLGLRPGCLAAAVVKATTVVVESLGELA
ncbi:TOBE domain-containing protein [Mobilicoccus caccae]|uniref:MerR family transcriptional regulator n=1 Tax=Mobilicoccus caccae TaxID=1859295 RepID=A0ABQ6IW34_9MICO|nr:TOBE domain-containing protein [Mobilicoccus caccae]GMA40942.1 MerR family transcriptional regulator [Mobilicoccus caccae]